MVSQKLLVGGLLIIKELLTREHSVSKELLTIGLLVRTKTASLCEFYGPKTHQNLIFGGHMV